MFALMWTFLERYEVMSFTHVFTVYIIFSLSTPSNENYILIHDILAECITYGPNADDIIPGDNDVSPHHICLFLFPPDRMAGSAG